MFISSTSICDCGTQHELWHLTTNLDPSVWFATTMTLNCMATKLFHAVMVCFQLPIQSFSLVDCYLIETCLERIADRECALECGENKTAYHGEKHARCCGEECGPSRVFSLLSMLISSSSDMLWKT